MLSFNSSRNEMPVRRTPPRHGPKATSVLPARHHSTRCCVLSRRPEGRHSLAAVGADNSHKNEIHPALLSKAKVVCDVLEQCAVMGDLHHALESGAMSRSDVYAELGCIVAGREARKGNPTKKLRYSAARVYGSTGCGRTPRSVYERAVRQMCGAMRLRLNGRLS